MDISTFSSVTKHFFDKLMDGALHKLEQKPYANTRISTAAGFNISSSTSAPSIQPQPANLNMEATDPLQTRRHSLRDTPPAAPAPYPTQVKGRRPIFPQTIPPVCAPMVSLNISFFTNSTDKTYGNFARSILTPEALLRRLFPGRLLLGLQMPNITRRLPISLIVMG